MYEKRKRRKKKINFDTKLANSKLIIIKPILIWQRLGVPRRILYEKLVHPLDV